MSLDWKKGSIFVVVLVLSVALWGSTKSEQVITQRLLTGTYATTTTRTNSVTNNCVGLTRTTLVSSTTNETVIAQKASVNSQLNLNGSLLISTAINGDLSGALAILTNSVVGLAIFIAVFAVGFLITIVSWPFLICCCCCPSCCPSKCCQKDDRQEYTKCELYWPSIVLILALLLTIASSAYGISQAGGISTGVVNMGCAVAILLDDFLNGNATVDGTSFFLGLNTLNVQLTNVNGNITTINNQLTDLKNAGGSNMQQYLTKTAAALTDITKIPASGNANPTPSNNLTLTYATPIDSAATTGTISSIFPQILGNHVDGGIVKPWFDAVNSVSTSLTTIATSAASFSSASGGFSGAIGGVQTAISSLVTQVSSGDTNIGTYITIAGTGDQLKMYVSIVYAVLIGFAFLALLGVLIMTFCGKYSCRYLMYFSCIFILLITIIGFLITIVFSILVPVLNMGCDFMNSSLSSSAKFQANFGFLGTSITNYVTPCLASSNGDLITAIGAGAVADTLKNISTVFSGINTFNLSSANSTMVAAMNAVISTIDDYGLGKFADITDSATLALLSKYADPSQFSTCGAATAGFNSDSWVPSITQNSTWVTCTQSGATATFANCNAAFSGITAPCIGCMDTSQIFIGNVTKANVKAALDSRYTGGACTAANGFNDMFSNVWTNYYKVKIAAIHPTFTGSPAYAGTVVRERAVTAQTSTNTVLTALISGNGPANSDITSIFNAVTTALSSINSIVDPTYGVLAGLNCRLFGEDIQRVVDVLCINFFGAIYITRLVLGIACYGFLFALCCIVCSGVRHYKHSQQQQQNPQVKDAFGNSSFNGTNQQMQFAKY